MTHILGILNVTADSFSDGGMLLDRSGRVDLGAAVARARQLVAEGADFIDVGAESSHPDAADVDADEEIRRLAPVVAALVADRIRVSVDTYKPRVMAETLHLGASMINDITALRDADAAAVIRGSGARVILMHSRSAVARATRGDAPGNAVSAAPDSDRSGASGSLIGRICVFFQRRIAELEDSGLDRAQLILDPGMGFFLGSRAEDSLEVLSGLPRLRNLGLPICVSTSRKSFIGEVLGRAVGARGAGTLATELWAARCGADYLRTHDVQALHDALRMTAAIERARESPPDSAS